MPFKQITNKKKNYSDIEALFRDLNSNGVESLYSHQADILRSYQKEAFNKTDVAIELPTGSGKTLVGLLIGEFRRVTNESRVLYLCPTNQLVNQVVDLANNKYGIKATSFIGSKRAYTANSISSFLNSESIAVTNYSSLFNTNPFFKECNIIIADDVHTAENYIASAWSVQISRVKDANVYDNLVEFLRDSIGFQAYLKLSKPEPDYLDKSWVDKLAFDQFYQIRDDLQILLENILVDSHLKFPWLMVKNNFHACNIFFSWSGILIRPLIPPSKENVAFANAQQRIFMSATLGNGGDLERTTGIEQFHRIPVPEGWNKEGLGRRFFVFPEQSFEEEEITEFIDEVVELTPRTVILTSSDIRVDEWKDHFIQHFDNIGLYTAKDIEASKKDFLSNEKAVMVLANRFDGIDFPGDESRLLIISDIPYSANFQERFLQTRLNASIVFYDRNRTRLIQAIGRCTRSPKDYSVVIAEGGELLDWLTLKDKSQFFHPELQSELAFGIEQSRSVSINDLIENIFSFLQQSEEWKIADRQIIEHRDTLIKSDIPGEKELNNVVINEIKYMYAFWNADYERAFDFSHKVLEGLSGGDILKGYRAFWAYLSGACAWLNWKDTNQEIYHSKAQNLFHQAISTTPNITWLRNLGKQVVSNNNQIDEKFLNNVDNLQITLLGMKVANRVKFNNNVARIEESLMNRRSIEKCNEEIGKLLGFVTGNNNSSGAPDPWWVCMNNLLFVFEDKLYDNDNDSLTLTHIRQAKTHESWVKGHLSNLSEDVVVYTIILTNSQSVDAAHEFACADIHYWNYYDFLKWASIVITAIRNIGKMFSGIGENSWHEYIINEFIQKKLMPSNVIEQLRPLSELIKKNN